MVDTSLVQLEQMFRSMKNESGWNINGHLLWGYFFTDRNPQRLEPLAQHLSELGYRFVSIYETDDRSTHFLHVERIETHTPISLLKHTIQMNVLAKQFAVDSYDGADVVRYPQLSSWAHKTIAVDVRPGFRKRGSFDCVRLSLHFAQDDNFGMETD